MPDSSEIDGERVVRALFFGVLVAAALFGITTIQTCLYHYRCKSDSIALKGSVSLLWILDCINLVFDVGLVYHFCVQNFANPEAVYPVVFPWQLKAIISLTMISDSVIRGVFAYRLWKLSEKMWHIIASICGFTIAMLIAGFMCIALDVDSMAKIGRESWIMYIAFGSDAAAESLTAISLCYFLAPKRTGYKRTDAVIRALLVYAIVTATVAMLIELFTIIAFKVWPNYPIFIAIYFSLPKLLLMSLLTSMNAREGLREQLHTTRTAGLAFTSVVNVITAPRNASTGNDTSSQLEQGAYLAEIGPRWESQDVWAEKAV